MPKKTKRAKIRAEQRRHVSHAAPLVYNEPQTFAFRTPHHEEAYKTSDPDRMELSVISRDLIKTVILAGLAIGVELAIYFRIGAK